MAIFREISGLALIAFAGTLALPTVTTTSSKVSLSLFAFTRATTAYRRSSALVVPGSAQGRVTMVATNARGTHRRNHGQRLFCATSLEFLLIDPPQNPTRAAVTCLSVRRSIRRVSEEGKRSIEEQLRVRRQ